MIISKLIYYILHFRNLNLNKMAKDQLPLSLFLIMFLF